MLIILLVNGFGAIAAMIGPAVIGRFTQNQSLAEWKVVMWILVGVMIITTILYNVFTTAERQPWDYPEGSGEQQSS